MSRKSRKSSARTSACRHSAMTACLLVTEQPVTNVFALGIGKRVAAGEGEVQDPDLLARSSSCVGEAKRERGSSAGARGSDEKGSCKGHGCPGHGSMASTMDGQTLSFATDDVDVEDLDQSLDEAEKNAKAIAEQPVAKAAHTHEEGVKCPFCQDTVSPGESAASVFASMNFNPSLQSNGANIHLRCLLTYGKFQTVLRNMNKDGWNADETKAYLYTVGKRPLSDKLRYAHIVANNNVVQLNGKAEAAQKRFDRDAGTGTDRQEYTHLARIQEQGSTELVANSVMTVNILHHKLSKDTTGGIAPEEVTQKTLREDDLPDSQDWWTVVDPSEGAVSEGEENTVVPKTYMKLTDRFRATGEMWKVQVPKMEAKLLGELLFHATFAPLVTTNYKIRHLGLIIDSEELAPGFTSGLNPWPFLHQETGWKHIAAKLQREARSLSYTQAVRLEDLRANNLKSTILSLAQSVTKYTKRDGEKETPFGGAGGLLAEKDCDPMAYALKHMYGFSVVASELLDSTVKTVVAAKIDAAETTVGTFEASLESYVEHHVGLFSNCGIKRDGLAVWKERVLEAYDESHTASKLQLDECAQRSIDGPIKITKENQQDLHLIELAKVQILNENLFYLARDQIKQHVTPEDFAPEDSSLRTLTAKEIDAAVHFYNEILFRALVQEADMESSYHNPETPAKTFIDGNHKSLDVNNVPNLHGTFSTDTRATELATDEQIYASFGKGDETENATMKQWRFCNGYKTAHLYRKPIREILKGLLRIWNDPTKSTMIKYRCELLTVEKNPEIQDTEFQVQIPLPEGVLPGSDEALRLQGRSEVKLHPKKKLISKMSVRGYDVKIDPGNKYLADKTGKKRGRVELTEDILSRVLSEEQMDTYDFLRIKMKMRPEDMSTREEHVDRDPMSREGKHNKPIDKASSWMHRIVTPDFFRARPRDLVGVLFSKTISGKGDSGNELTSFLHLAIAQYVLAAKKLEAYRSAVDHEDFDVQREIKILFANTKPTLLGVSERDAVLVKGFKDSTIKEPKPEVLVEGYNYEKFDVEDYLKKKLMPELRKLIANLCKHMIIPAKSAEEIAAIKASYKDRYHENRAPSSSHKFKIESKDPRKPDTFLLGTNPAEADQINGIIDTRNSAKYRTRFLVEAYADLQKGVFRDYLEENKWIKETIREALSAEGYSTFEPADQAQSSGLDRLERPGESRSSVNELHTSHSGNGERRIVRWRGWLRSFDKPILNRFVDFMEEIRPQ